MEGIVATVFGDRLLEKSSQSREYARLMWRYTRDEQLACKQEIRVPIGRAVAVQSSCREGCAGCRELERILASLEKLWPRKDVGPGREWFP